MTSPIARRPAPAFRALPTLLAALALAALIGGCKDGGAIVNHWLHAYEEDSAGVQVYRPSTFAFGPAFGRDGFDLRRDGSAIVYSVGPADEPLATPGRWALSDDGMLTVTPDGARPRRFEVAHLDSTQLRLRVMR